MKHKNPPAFPRPISHDVAQMANGTLTQGDYPQYYDAQVGMTLRDYFAAKALVTIYNHPDAAEPDSPEQVAEWCYRTADAMLAERSK